jgi:hypothetical protein
MAKKRPTDEPIDFAADMEDSDLKTAMRTLRQGRKRPTTANAANPSKASPKAPTTSIQPPTSHIDIYNNIDSRDNMSSIEYDIPRDIIDIEAKLTLPELKFLELHLVHRLTVPKALRAAKFPNIDELGKTALYDLGGKIRKKYESAIQDKREIFRDIGLGESQVALNIKALTESSSEKIKLGANKLAADCLRLTEQPPPSHQGVNIIINCGPAAPAPLPPGHVPPAQVVVQGEVVESEPLKPRQITK